MSQPVPTPAPDPTPDPTPAPEPPAPTPDPVPDPEPRTFTQDEVNALMARQKRDLLAAEPDLAELRRKAKHYDDLEEANKSELQKATDRATQLEAELEASRTSMREERLRSAIVGEAARRGVVDPDAAVALIDRSAIDFTDDGTPNNIAGAMDSLLQARPYLQGKPGGTHAGSADQGARPPATSTQPQLDREALAGMTAEQIVEARKSGSLDAVLKGQPE